MPWQECDLMTVRYDFVRECKAGILPIAELCRRHGVSRKTAYKWLARFEAGGITELVDKSRAPHRQPRQTDDAIVSSIVQLKRKYPSWGAKKIAARLSSHHPGATCPAVSTIQNILQAHGLVACQKRNQRFHHANHATDLPIDRANGVWNVDFKGEFRLGCGQLCYPLTASDACSRYLLKIQGLTTTAIADAKQVFEALFSYYGLPEYIRSDNGVPFASFNGLARLSRLSVWFIQLGITPFFTRPGHPGDNGAHERMHRELKRETALPPGFDHREQQGRFDRFRFEYNHERPHEALNMQVPSARYEWSPRRYEHGKLFLKDYPGHWEKRRVTKEGQIRFKGHLVNCATALATQDVGLEPLDDRIWGLHFGHVQLGYLDERIMKIRESLTP